MERFSSSPSSSTNFPSGYPQISFRPASGNSSDLLDLNELFADEYQDDLESSRFPTVADDSFTFSTHILQPINSDNITEKMEFMGEGNVPPIAPASSIENTKLFNSSDNTSVKIRWDEQQCLNSFEFNDHQKVERRERNREHAKRSRIRKKLLLDSLQLQLLKLRQENIQLRRLVVERIPDQASKILAESTTVESRLLSGIAENDDFSNRPATDNMKPSPLTTNIASNLIHSVSNNVTNQSFPKQHSRILMEPDYRLIQSLVTSQQNFVLSDPSLPDNPIVYASEGFCKLTGYKRQEVLGRNCRFLQGPLTDQKAVEIIRKGIAEGRDISVCLLNYKADGKPFWNQFFLAALKDAEGQVVNYVGVQCEVNNISVYEIKDRVKRLPLPTDL